MKYTIRQKAQEHDPDRVWMDDKDCIRMKRSEFEATRMLLGALRFIEIAVEDLKDRMGMIPDGEARTNAGLKQMNDVATDIIGTMTVTQCKQVWRTQSDMIFKLTPKLAQNSPNVLMEKDVAKGLIDIAMEKCRDCVEDGTSCQQCKLYQVLEAVSPMEEYSDIRCPYAITFWE